MPWRPRPRRAVRGALEQHADGALHAAAGRLQRRARRRGRHGAVQQRQQAGDGLLHGRSLTPGVSRGPSGGRLSAARRPPGFSGRHGCGNTYITSCYYCTLYN